MTLAHGDAAAPGTNEPADLHLSRLVARRCGRHPGRAALLAPGLPPLTYRELARRVEETGRVLRDCGITPADRVALALPHGPSAAVAYLGAACAGQAAPLDPAGRAAEFDFYLTDLDARAVITEQGGDSLAAAVARAQGRRVIELAPDPAGPAGAFTLTPGPAATTTTGTGTGTGTGGIPAGGGGREDRGEGRGGEVAFVLHTSGTTGRPKLVPLTHRAVCTSAHNIALSLRLGEGDRCLNVLPLFHGHGLMGPWLATLSAGADVVCPPGFDASAFPGQLREYAPTWYTAVPAIHQAVLTTLTGPGGPTADGPGGPGGPGGGRLRLVRSASAPLPGAVARALEETLGVPVIDSYGMTEACSIITSGPLPPRARKPGSSGVSIGADVAVMDPRGALLPPGENGEIVLRGPTVIGGYAHNPDADAAAFTRGWFRTGDSGHLDEDGHLFITGRLKEIINRGGSKVSPLEVDGVLCAHPAVAEAAAFALPHPTLGEEVAAAVVLRPGARAGDDDLRAFLTARLTAHKIPRRIFRTTAIPRTSTGKIQRTALTARFTPAPRTAPGTPPGAAPGAGSGEGGAGAQAAVTGIWAEVLGTAAIGPHDHFFDLGGNSLLIRRVQRRLRETTGADIPVVDLFAHPTVTALARYLAHRTGTPPQEQEQEREQQEQEREQREREREQRERGPDRGRGPGPAEDGIPAPGAARLAGRRARRERGDTQA
ncbi:non-ribosomal peptide synthetase [Streptomyces sp. NPDC001889]